MTSDVHRDIARRTRRSLLAGGLAALAGAAGWEWLRTRRDDAGVPWPLRLGLRANERLARDYFRPTRLTRTFPASAVESGRPNGDVGLEDDVPANWSLEFEGRHLALREVQALPKFTQITELKCIEGWSRVLQWSGARFRDFVAQYAPGRLGFNGYVAMETPGGDYYVGLDMASAMHPQTILAYEMNGAPLQAEHGAPLRLVIPVKYGIKNLKRIGRISFHDSRPADYWAERGYDWYAGF